MRRLLPLLAAMAVLACGAGVSGTYDLVTINDQELPFSYELFGAFTSGSLALTSDSTFTATLTGSFGDEETATLSGAFTLDEPNVIHFASDDEDPFEGTWDGDQITFSLDDLTLVFRR